MTPTLVGAIQAVLVAALVFGGQYVVAKLSKRAQDAHLDVDQQSRATEAWVKYAEKMESRLGVVELRLLEAERREESNRRRIAALERQQDQDLDLVARLHSRLVRAHDEIRRLGGHVSDADLEVADLALHRLNHTQGEPHEADPHSP